MKRTNQTLTKTVVENLQRSEKEYTIWDSKLTGFGVRVYPSETKTFVAQWRDKAGDLHKRKIGKFGVITVDEARTKAKAILSQATLGIVEEKPLPSKRFEDLMEVWLSGPALRHRRRKSPRKPDSIANDRRNLELHVLPVLRGKKLREITVHDIDLVFLRASEKRPHPDGKKRKGRGYRGSLGGSGAASRTIRTLKSVFAYAVDQKWITLNPASGYAVPADNKRATYLSNGQCAEVQAAIEAARGDGVRAIALDIITLWRITGCRRSEIEKLLWSEVDLAGGFLRLRDTKTGPKEKVLGPQAREIISRQSRRAGNPYVFPSAHKKKTTHYHGASKVWRTLRHERWPDVRPHDLRHTFASTLAEKGESLPTIGALLGHTDPRSTQRYAHLSHEHLRKAAQAAETHV